MIEIEKLWTFKEKQLPICKRSMWFVPPEFLFIISHWLRLISCMQQIEMKALLNINSVWGACDFSLNLDIEAHFILNQCFVNDSWHSFASNIRGAIWLKNGKSRNWINWLAVLETETEMSEKCLIKWVDYCVFFVLISCASSGAHISRL